MSNAPVVHVDLDAFWHDPYPALADMRSSTPICFVPELNATLLTKRNDIHTCEKNVDVFSSDQPGGLMNELMGKNMMRSDGEEHRKERFVYYPAVSPRTVRATWAAQFEQLGDTVIAGLLQGGRATDMVATYATALSGEALKAMTGLTNITYQEMDAWSQAMIDGVANYGGDPQLEDACRQATASIDAAIDDRLPELQASPDHSLLSVMLGSGMPIDNVRANIKLTISGGQNEPRDAIAGALWALLTHRDQLGLILRGHATWLDAFEEYCRWVSPIGMSPRRIAVEHSFGGVDFAPEDRVFLMFGSANRDEDHFERSDQFDLTRDNRANLTFGAGPHFCAGAAASRSLVGDVALPKALLGLPGLELDESSSQVRFGGWAFRGPLTMPVRWSVPD